MAIPTLALVARWSLCRVRAASTLCWGCRPRQRPASQDLRCRGVSWTVRRCCVHVQLLRSLMKSTHPAECWRKLPLHNHTDFVKSKCLPFLFYGNATSPLNSADRPPSDSARASDSTFVRWLCVRYKLFLRLRLRFTRIHHKESIVQNIWGYAKGLLW